MDFNSKVKAGQLNYEESIKYIQDNFNDLSLIPFTKFNLLYGNVNNDKDNNNRLNLSDIKENIVKDLQKGKLNYFLGGTELLSNNMFIQQFTECFNPLIKDSVSRRYNFIFSLFPETSPRIIRMEYLFNNSNSLCNIKFNVLFADYLHHQIKIDDSNSELANVILGDRYNGIKDFLDTLAIFKQINFEEDISSHMDILTKISDYLLLDSVEVLLSVIQKKSYGRNIEFDLNKENERRDFIFKSLNQSILLDILSIINVETESLESKLFIYEHQGYKECKNSLATFFSNRLIDSIQGKFLHDMKEDCEMKNNNSYPSDYYSKDLMRQLSDNLNFKDFVTNNFSYKRYDNYFEIMHCGSYAVKYYFLKDQLRFRSIQPDFFKNLIESKSSEYYERISHTDDLLYKSQFGDQRIDSVKSYYLFNINDKVNTKSNSLDAKLQKYIIDKLIKIFSVNVNRYKYDDFFEMFFKLHSTYTSTESKDKSKEILVKSGIPENLYQLGEKLILEKEAYDILCHKLKDQNLAPLKGNPIYGLHSAPSPKLSDIKSNNSPFKWKFNSRDNRGGSVDSTTSTTKEGDNVLLAQFIEQLEPISEDSTCNEKKRQSTDLTSNNDNNSSSSTTTTTTTTTTSSPSNFGENNRSSRRHSKGYDSLNLPPTPKFNLNSGNENNQQPNSPTTTVTNNYIFNNFEYAKNKLNNRENMISPDTTEGTTYLGIYNHHNFLIKISEMLLRIESIKSVKKYPIDSEHDLKIYLVYLEYFLNFIIKENHFNIYSQTFDLFIQGLIILVEISLEKKNHRFFEYLFKTDITEYLIIVLNMAKDHPSNKLNIVCTTYLALISESVECKKWFSKANGIRVLLQYMKHISDLKELDPNYYKEPITNILFTLKNLTEDQDFLNLMSSEDASKWESAYTINMVVSLTELSIKFAQDSRILIYIVEIVGNLSLDEKFNQRLLDSGVISSIVKGLGSGSMKLITTFLNLVYNVHLKNNSFFEKFEKQLGGVPQVIVKYLLHCESSSTDFQNIAGSFSNVYSISAYLRDEFKVLVNQRGIFDIITNLINCDQNLVDPTISMINWRNGVDPTISSKIIKNCDKGLSSRNIKWFNLKSVKL